MRKLFLIGLCGVRNLISIAGAGGKENVRLGWWNMGTQVGTAIKEHPALAGIPHDGTMSPLFFRLVKDTGLPLPAEGISPDEMIIVGEGGEKCFCYLAERKEGESRLLECHGLDLVSDTPEGNAVLRSFVDYLAK